MCVHLHSSWIISITLQPCRLSTVVRQLASRQHWWRKTEMSISKACEQKHQSNAPVRAPLLLRFITKSYDSNWFNPLTYFAHLPKFDYIDRSKIWLYWPIHNELANLKFEQIWAIIKPPSFYNDTCRSLLIHNPIHESGKHRNWKEHHAPGKYLNLCKTVS